MTRWRKAVHSGVRHVRNRAVRGAPVVSVQCTHTVSNSCSDSMGTSSLVRRPIGMSSCARPRRSTSISSDTHASQTEARHQPIIPAPPRNAMSNRLIPHCPSRIMIDDCHTHTAPRKTTKSAGKKRQKRNVPGHDSRRIGLGVRALRLSADVLDALTINGATRARCARRLGRRRERIGAGVPHAHAPPRAHHDARRHRQHPHQCGASRARVGACAA